MASAEDMSVAPPSWKTGAGAGPAASAPRRRLFRKYALLFIGLVGAALLVNSGFDFWFSYQENKAALVRVQQEKADAAAQRVEEFVDEIKSQIGWTTHAQWAAGPLDQRRQDYFRLLRQVPAITELTQLDSDGREQLTVSRLKMDVIGSNADLSQSPGFVEAKAHRVWFSPVYFRKQSEPYMTLAMAREGKNAGVTVAEINLKLIYDVITALKIGQGGYTYVVDGRGKLLAHPDISLVLRDTDLSKLPQVAAALHPIPDAPAVAVAGNIGGHSVLTAHAAIPQLGWLVFVEVPLQEAFAPLYGAAWRTGLLLLLGLVAAALAALVLARRMTGPIRAIAAGAERLGAGDLSGRIDIHTGDELEGLAQQFNSMAADLQKSYAELEQRVVDRTAELSEALDQQTATAEVLGVINSSPGDLTPVFDAMLERAIALCEAAFGSLLIYDGERLQAAALRSVPDAFAEFLRTPLVPEPGTAMAWVLKERRLIHWADASAEGGYAQRLPLAVAGVDGGGVRTLLGVPLIKDARVLGIFHLYRQEVRPFTDKQIALLQNFAAQAVIAMENARLITETREALEQQTATAEVLGVINSSPGDLAPVFEAMLERAMRLCDAACSALNIYDGECIRTVASRGMPAELAAFLEQPVLPEPGTASMRLIGGETFVHIADLIEDEGSQESNPARWTFVKASGARTQLAVPLRKENTLLGIFIIYRPEVRPFSDKEIALLQNFAAQAVIAMENARLITETREALEQQTATAEVLGVINASPGKLTPVFDAMLEKATRLCEAAFGVLATPLDDDRHTFSIVAMRRVPAALADYLSRPVIARTGSGIGRVARGEDIVHIIDSATDEAYEAGLPERRALVDLGGARSQLTIALRKDRYLLGAFTLWRQEVKPFTDKQIALLQNFAAQAVIAMENARLITETREALEQQTATAEVLGVINSSPGDLAPVFDAMLEKALRLCEASFGSFAVFDGELLHAAAHRNVPNELVEAMRHPLRGTPESGAQGGHLFRLLSGENVIPIADFADTDAYRVGLAWAVALVDKGGARTAIWVALRKEAKLLGALVIYRQEVRPFTDKQIALLQNFAAQAVIAMENARLITETREALEQQTATAEVLGVINSSPGDLAPVFDALLEKAVGLCGATFGMLTRFDGERYHAAALHGVPTAFEESWREPRLPTPGLTLYRLIQGEDIVHVEDVTAEDAYQSGNPIRRALADLGGARTALWVALRKEHTLLGAFVLYRQEVRPFAPKQIELVRTFAEQAVIAIDNARLITETRERTRDLQESLEYQTATSDVLKVISRSTFDLKPVLETLIETAARLCGAHVGMIADRDGQVLATFAFLPEFDAIVRDINFEPGRGSVTGRALLDRRFVHIADIAADPEYVFPEVISVGRMRTALAVPLLRHGEPIGAIYLARQHVEPFSERQIELVQTFADQAVIAIENARLLGALRERTDELARSVEELKALSEVGQEVSSTLDLGGVLSTILNRSVALAGADAGAIFRYSEGQRVFRLAEAVGWDDALVGKVRELHIAEAETGMGEATRRRVPLQLPDLTARPSYPLRDATLAAGFRSVLIVPLVGAERILGAIVLERRAAGEFTEATVRLMQTLASQSVLAIQNARLFREIADKSEELRLASQHKSQFLANMSHELRTPMNAILGYTELMVDGIYGDLPEKAAGVLERVQNNGKHLLALINDVLDLSKIEAGQLVFTFEDYALPDVVQSVVTATEALASTKGLKMSADVAPALPMGRGDARRLQQVLLNLVGNAVKFTDEGEVAIGARAENGHFVLTVRDTGPGIAAEDQGKIFEEFQQVDSSNTRKKGGTGLGLAISKRMVEMQGGTISVESELGHGATFRVALPIRVEEVAEELMGAA